MHSNVTAPPKNTPKGNVSDRKNDAEHIVKPPTMRFARRVCLIAVSLLSFTASAGSTSDKFDSFLGLHRGETATEVKKLFGEPIEESSGGEVTLTYIRDLDMKVTVDAVSHRITSIVFPFPAFESDPDDILADQKEWLARKGIREENLRFLGMTASVLKKQFQGRLKDGFSNAFPACPALVYSPFPGTTVKFRLSSSDTYNKVLDIEIQWSN
jgi:hypothetical protein